MELEEIISESDLVKKIDAKKEVMVKDNTTLLSTLKNKDLNLSLAYIKVTI